MSAKTLEELLAGIQENWVTRSAPPSRPLRIVQDKLNRLEQSIPASYRWATVDSPLLAQRVKAEGVHALARSFEASPQDLVIIGSAGMGKTSLAVAALQLMPPGRTRFVHAYRLGIARIQHSAGDGEHPLVEMAMTMPHILLDDVGNERNTSTNALPDVVFERHAADLLTWYTTAFEPADIAKKYGEGIARRMFERARIVRLGGSK